MANWYAASDETGSWDILNGRFGSSYVGVGWVLGSGQAWQKALTMSHDGETRLKTLTTSFAARFPSHRIDVEGYYHVKNVWDYCYNEGIAGNVVLDASHEDPVVDALRSDMAWLLKESGLALLAAGDNEERARLAGLGASGDHMRERARAMAALMGVALPFIPEHDGLILLPARRSEDCESDIVRAAGAGASHGARKDEPYRDFLGRLREDLDGVARSCSPLLASGKIISDIRFYDHPEDMDPIVRKEQFVAARNEFPLLYSKSGDLVKAAMWALADLAAAFAPRPLSKLKFIVPTTLGHNLWAGSLSNVVNAFRRG